MHTEIFVVYKHNIDESDHIDVAVSTFFALHRPVSIFFPVPGEYNSSTFSSIFDDLTPTSINNHRRQQADIQAKTAGNPSFPHMDSEEALSHSTSATDKASAAVRQAVAQSLVQLPNHILNGRFPHFLPPPPPQPMPNWHRNFHLDKWSHHAKQLEERLVQHRGKKRPKQQQVVVAFQKMDNGKYSVEIESQPMSFTLRDRSFAMRMALRRKVFYEKRRPLMIIRALSVKRQRKLKMKKHKYKKLMRKTRSIRRRLEKQ